MTRTIARRAGALALVLVTVVLVAAPARAAAYRYWTYWQAAPGATAWTFATQGPGTSVPADGSVEGWSFGVTTQSGSPEDAPATSPADFAAICGSTPVEDGRKRIALVIDPGPASVAPDGQTPPSAVATCVVADPEASGYDILRSVADVRTEDGLICGVDGYPTGECAPILSDSEAAELATAPSAAPSGSAMASGTDAPPTGGATSGSPVATIVVGVLLIGGAAVLVRRMRRST
jgi:hypothetical protein